MRPGLSETSAQQEGAPVELTILAFIGIIAAACLTAALGALVSPGAMDPWYQALNRAPGNPPGYVFGAVWPALYTLMAIGACRVWLKAGGWRKADTPLGLYFLQLVVNLGWSVLFFHFHLAVAALIDIAALWVLTLLMIIEFNRVSPARLPAAIPLSRLADFCCVSQLLDRVRQLELARGQQPKQRLARRREVAVHPRSLQPAHRFAHRRTRRDPGSEHILSANRHPRTPPAVGQCQQPPPTLSRRHPRPTTPGSRDHE